MDCCGRTAKIEDGSKVANPIERMKRMVQAAQLQEHAKAAAAMPHTHSSGSQTLAGIPIGLGSSGSYRGGETEDTPKSLAVRDMLTTERANVLRRLNDLDSCLAILDANPEIDRLITTIARLGI